MELQRLMCALSLFLVACDVPFPPAGTGSTSDADDVPARTEAELCEDACVNESECWLPPGAPAPELDTCIETCIENLRAFDGDSECARAMHDLTTCMADATTCEPACLEPSAEAIHACEVAHGDGRSG